MTCSFCADKGVIMIRYREGPGGQMDLGICQCRIGQRYRNEKAMQALAANYGMDRAHIGLVEELLDPEDLPVLEKLSDLGKSLDVTEAGCISRKKARL